MSPKDYDIMVDVMASLAATISLLERTPPSRKAAPSATMFNQMMDDYRASLERARTHLKTVSPT